MSEKKPYQKREFIILLILIFSIIVSSVIIIVTYNRVKTYHVEEEIPITTRDYTVLVAGSAEDTSFLNKVFEGTSIVKNFYDCTIMYYELDPYSSENNIQSLLDYAGFINADCVITHLRKGVKKLNLPRNRDDKIIPLITTGYYSPEIDSIAHIGIGYDELGIAMAEEAINYLNGSGNIFLLNISGDEYYSNLLVSNMSNRLQQEEEIRVVNFYPDRNTEYTLEDNVRQQIASSGKIDLILAISEQESVLAVQTLSDLNLSSRTKIIGFGDGEESLDYAKRGLITKLFTSNAVEIGKKALQEFSNYKTTGSANNVKVDFTIWEKEIESE